jgi:hypothetical protein
MPNEPGQTKTNDVQASQSVSDSDREKLLPYLEAIEKIMKSAEGNDKLKELHQQAESLYKKWADQRERITTLADLDYAKSQLKNGEQMLKKWKEAVEKE